MQSNENITVVHQTLSIIVSLEHSDLIILFFVLRHDNIAVQQNFASVIVILDPESRMDLNFCQYSSKCVNKYFVPCFVVQPLTFNTNFHSV